MGARATVTIPLNLADENDRFDAATILENVAGGEPPSITDSSVTLEMQMPGNLASIVSKLEQRRLFAGGPLTVSVPLRSLAIPETPASGDDLLEALRYYPEIHTASIAGDRLEAMVEPSTAPLFIIYREALKAGLVPQDVPTLVALRGL